MKTMKTTKTSHTSFIVGEEINIRLSHGRDHSLIGKTEVVSLDEGRSGVVAFIQGSKRGLSAGALVSCEVVAVKSTAIVVATLEVVETPAAYYNRVGKPKKQTIEDLKTKFQKL